MRGQLSRHRMVQFCKILVAFHLCLGLNSAAFAEFTESQLRALTIAGILRYAHWHPPLTREPPMVCQLGTTHSYALLSESREKVMVQGVSPLFRDANTELALHQCDIMLVGEGVSERQHEALTKASLLTICDNCSRPRMYAVSVFKKDARIRFSVNLSKSRAAGVQFSSAMMEIAEEVL